MTIQPQEKMLRQITETVAAEHPHSRDFEPVYDSDEEEDYAEEDQEDYVEEDQEDYAEEDQNDCSMSHTDELGADVQPHSDQDGESDTDQDGESDTDESTPTKSLAHVEPPQAPKKRRSPSDRLRRKLEIELDFIEIEMEEACDAFEEKMEALEEREIRARLALEAHLEKCRFPANLRQCGKGRFPSCFYSCLA